MEKSGDKYVLREFQPEDYAEYSSWWRQGAPPAETLPQIGMVVGDMKAAGFLAVTDTSFTIITWWHANPNNTNKESYMAIKKYIQGCVDATRLLNKKHVFCYTPKRGMIRMLESLGFNELDAGHWSRSI